ncbi:MAG: NAD-dependent epimerase/dehydratase family protein [Gemmatimonadota bacterium]
MTGATGFIGGHLVRRLIEEGGGVRALVRPATAAAHLEALGVEVVRGDLADSAALRRAATGCDVVYHLAGVTSTKRPGRHALETANVAGTRNVARAALAAGVGRLVYGSSIGTFGAAFARSPVNETTPARPDSTYRVSKLRGEHAVTAAARDGLPAVVARIGSTMGPGARHWRGLFRAVAERRVRRIGALTNRIQPVHVADVIDGLRRCGTVPRIEGGLFLLVGPEPIRVGELLERIAAAVGTTLPAGRLPGAPFRAWYRLGQWAVQRTGREIPWGHRHKLFMGDEAVDFAGTRDRLGYAPRVTVVESIRQTAEWLRAEGLLPPVSRSGAPADA